MNKLKEKFETKDKNGNAITLAVQVPSAHIKQRARLARAKAYADALKNGAMMSEVLDRYLREQNLWDDERQERADKLREFLVDAEAKLDGGGIKLKEAKSLALEMSAKRSELINLLSVRSGPESQTANHIADQAEFDFLVAHCTVYNDSGKPYFTKDGENASVEAYLEQSTESASFDAAAALDSILYGRAKEVLDKLPEVRFLKEYKFMNENGHLVDEKGRLVDHEGRLVDEQDRYINEKGEFVDIQGRPVTEDGRFIKEFKPFLDDDGKPVGVKSSPTPDPEPEPQLPAPVPAEAVA